MSYILDALKRADAERERGHLPGLHTRTAPEPDTPAARVGGFAQRGGLFALGALLALGAVLLWWWLRAAPLAPPATLAVAAAARAPVAATSPATATAPMQPPEPSGDLVRQPDMPVLPILAPPPPRRTPKGAAAPAAAEPAATAQRTPDNAVSKRASAHAFASPATLAAAPVTSFAELSPDDRARLPAVNLSGSTYSKNPALRMLIINGKVVQEGGEIAPGLTLETIAPRSAVLNHQGLRYRIGY